MRQTVPELARIRFIVEQKKLEEVMLRRYPISRYVYELDHEQKCSVYGFFPERALRMSTSIESEFGTDALDSYHKLVLLTLIGTFEERAQRGVYPPSVLETFQSYVGRILAQLDHRAPPGYYTHHNDLFAKDVAVCRHRLIPCGSALVDIFAGVPRSYSMATTGLSRVRFLSHMMTSVGGFRPIYQMHMDYRLIREFDADSWIKCYRRIAELLELHPEILGISGMTWWYDPALHDLSRHLDYLRDEPLSGGARIFKVGVGPRTVQLATVKSPERRSAYEQGTYKPTEWLLVWSRRDLISWARHQVRRQGARVSRETSTEM